MLKSTLAIVLGLSAVACNHECLQVPCALPIAVTIDVSSSSGTSVSGASVAVSGPITSNLACETSCVILGYAGTYTLTVTAPGYQSAERSVVVQGATPACGCASAKTERVSLVLTPA